MKKKILLLIDWFVPGYKAGGPIQSCVNLIACLKNDYDFFVLTTDTDHNETLPYEGIEPNTWNRQQMPGIPVYYLKKNTFQKKEIFQIIQQVNADFIYLNHLFSPSFVIYPLWLAWRGKINGKIILSPRGALHQSALAEKFYKKGPFIQLLKLSGLIKKIRFHATNDKEANEINQYLPHAEIVIANNLPSAHQEAPEYCKKTSGLVKCIIVSRIVPIKNHLFLLSVLKNVRTNVELSIVGHIEDKNYWEECLKMIATLPPNIKVSYKGSVQNKMLTSLLKEHHLFVLPTTGENFGHSIFEAWLAGRPVLISNNTPWRLLHQDKTGWDISLQSPGLFAEALEEAALWNQQEFEAYAKSSWMFANNFIHNPKNKEDYLKLFS